MRERIKERFIYLLLLIIKGFGRAFYRFDILNTVAIVTAFLTRHHSAHQTAPDRINTAAQLSKSGQLQGIPVRGFLVGLPGLIL